MPRRLPPSSVLSIAMATAVIVGIGTLALTGVHGNNLISDVAHIGIEHTRPLTLSLDLHRSHATWGVIDIGTISDELLFISLPDTWRRREVRNVPLTDVRTDPPSFGFVRYTFPPKAIVSFIVPDLPDHVLLHNPSEVPIQLNLTTVNTATQKAEHDVMLIQNSPKEVW